MMKCVQIRPDADFYYFADNANVPYGDLPKDRILMLVEEIFEKIARLQPNAAVIACNTVTAVCAEALRAKYSFPIVGIQPAIKPAASTGGKCVVLATPVTAASATVESLVDRFGGGHTEVVACPCLAAYIEENITNLSSEKVVNMLPDLSADSLVLGCTHYVFIEKMIAAHYSIPVFDGIDGTANRLNSILGKIDHFPQNQTKITFFGGDVNKNFQVFHHFFGK